LVFRMTSGSKSGRPCTKYGCWYSTILMLPLLVLLIFLKLQAGGCAAVARGGTQHGVACVACVCT
jgi:hypothetical protein